MFLHPIDTLPIHRIRRCFCWMLMRVSFSLPPNLSLSLSLSFTDLVQDVHCFRHLTKVHCRCAHGRIEHDNVDQCDSNQLRRIINENQFHVTDHHHHCTISNIYNQTCTVPSKWPTTHTQRDTACVVLDNFLIICWCTVSTKQPHHCPVQPEHIVNLQINQPIWCTGEMQIDASQQRTV